MLIAIAIRVDEAALRLRPAFLVGWLLGQQLNPAGSPSCCKATVLWWEGL